MRTKLKFKSFHLKYFFIEFNFFFYILFKLNLKPINIFIFNLPKKIKKFCIVRSPFVSKKSKEFFKLEFFFLVLYFEFKKVLYYIFYKKKIINILILYYFYIKCFYIEKLNLKCIY